MKLVMYFGLDCIDAVSLSKERISQPGYLGSLKRVLLEKHASDLRFLSGEPEFLIAQTEEREEKKNGPLPFTKRQPVRPVFAAR